MQHKIDSQSMKLEGFRTFISTVERAHFETFKAFHLSFMQLFLLRSFKNRKKKKNYQTVSLFLLFPDFLGLSASLSAGIRIETKNCFSF